MLAEAAPELVYDPAVIRRDRGQAIFQKTFLQFSDNLLGGGRIPNGQKKIKEHARLFARIEQRFGVPAPVLTAFWGLESDYGGNFGKFKILPALTTLAYDCRRGEYFRPELIDALKIVQRGDQRVADMVGSWAGEFGGMQFTASRYIQYGVDFDGDRRVDIIRSTPDTLASAANYVKDLGWKRGEPWLVEVTRARAHGVARGRPRHPASGVAMGEMGRARARTAACRARTCRRRWSCPWGVKGRPSSPIRTSRCSWAGIRRSSIRPRSPISPRGSPARRWSAMPAPRSCKSLSIEQVKELQTLLNRARLQRRRGRRQARQRHPRSGEEGAAQGRHAGRFLADRRIARQAARGLKALVVMPGAKCRDPMSSFRIKVDAGTSPAMTESVMPLHPACNSLSRCFIASGP